KVIRRGRCQGRVDSTVRVATRLIRYTVGTKEHQVIGWFPAQCEIRGPVIKCLIAIKSPVHRGALGGKNPCQGSVDIRLCKPAILGFVNIAHAASGLERWCNFPGYLAISG